MTTTALVVTGPYRFTRNPIYLGMTVTYLGAGILADSLWVLALAIPILFIIHLGVVLREEVYLAMKFGDAYQNLRARGAPLVVALTGGCGRGYNALGGSCPYGGVV